MKVKLHQFLSKAGVARKKYDIYELISNGRVKVGEKVVTAASYIFNPKKKRVYLDGKPIKQNKTITFAVNKPVGISCQKGENPNIYDWLSEKTELEESQILSLFTVGRLDKNSEGLIIMTNNGDLSLKLTRPENKIEKEYEAEVKGELKETTATKLVEGVVITADDKRCKVHATTFQIINATRDKSKIKIVITEGKKRQIRLMMKAIDHPVINLKRTRIGNLTLDSLKDSIQPLPPSFFNE